MKKTWKMIPVFLSALALNACSDSDDGMNDSAILEMYGQQYELKEGVIWENTPNWVVEQKEYVYDDTYENQDGEIVTDQVKGFTIGDNAIETGNFMLSLYENGLTYNEDLQVGVGEAACICFHLASPSKTELVSGKYTYAIDKRPNTFVAYASSDYNSSKSDPAAIITAGEVNVAKEGDNYVIDYVCKTSFDGVIQGRYIGPLHYSKVSLQVSSSFANLALAGLLKEVTTETFFMGTAAGVETDVDRDNGLAFFSTYSGSLKYAKNKGKEFIDVALVWDDENQEFRFESPIRMRSYLGHQDKYNFPCHTIYMKAPESFTDADYDNLEKNGFEFEIKDEKVTFPIEGFKSGYVFFQAGNGTKGVIKVKDFSPLGKKTVVEYPDILWYECPANPVLHVDIKCPTSVINPNIR